MWRWIALFFLPLFSFAQEANDSDLTFTIKASAEITVQPNCLYIMQSSSKIFRILPSGGDQISRVEASGGNIEMVKDNFYRISASTSELIMVNVYVKKPSGVEVLAKALTYKVIPHPNIKLSGVEKDYAISKMQLVFGGKITGYIPSIDKSVRILSFETYTTTDTLRANGSEMTPEMRKYANTLKDGNMMWLYNIKYQLPDGSQEVVPYFRVYVIDAGELKRLGF